MDASAETAIEASDDKAEDHHVTQDGDPDLDLDLELDLAKMGVTGKAPEFYNDSWTVKNTWWSLTTSGVVFSSWKGNLRSLHVVVFDRLK